MKGPTSSKATGLLTLPADVTFDTQVVINKADRSVGVINQRSNVPLTYTITKQQADGTLDLFTEDLSLQSSDFNGQVASGLFLVEGEFNSANGTFRGGVRTRQTFEITDGPVIEGSIGVSSTEGPTGTQYNEITSLFLASGGTQTVFEKTYTGGFGCVLTFGDGVRGRLPNSRHFFCSNLPHGRGW